MGLLRWDPGRWGLLMAVVGISAQLQNQGEVFPQVPSSLVQPSQDDSKQPLDEIPESSTTPDPYIIYGPHGYSTFPHSRCQEVPTVSAPLEEMEGDWFLIEYVNSHDGKPTGAHTPYICPEARMSINTDESLQSMNISQLSYEWPVIFLDKVEWIKHPSKQGVFFHEENMFSLWTMKIMDFDSRNHMVIFLCIDYTIWPGWNHRGVYILSRKPELKSKIKRKLSDRAHRRMRMNFDRKVNTTSCDPDDFLALSRERFHPHKAVNPALYRAPVHPYISRKHRRNLNNLD